MLLLFLIVQHFADAVEIRFLLQLVPGISIARHILKLLVEPDHAWFFRSMGLGERMDSAYQ